MSAHQYDPIESARIHGSLANRMQLRGHRAWALFHERKQIEHERVVESYVLALPRVTSVVAHALANRREVR